jgi:superfamily I DNA and/or RNA helicase
LEALAVSSASVLLPISFKQLGIAPLTFFDIPTSISHEEQVGKSFKNDTEISFIMHLLDKISTAASNELEGLSFGVITPYKGQCLRIRDRISQQILQRPNQSHSLLQRVEVNTVDGFQVN